MWDKIIGFFTGGNSSAVEQVGGLALDIREAIKGKEIDPTKLLEVYVEVEKLKVSVLNTELSGGWLQRNWRPILMMIAILIIANNYLFAPYFPTNFIELELPAELWTLLQIGVGGYVGGRSIEKAVKIYKN